ncbi:MULTISPECIES: TetR/AcrR family transcriptional regulator [Paenibacillus]|uniref:TetR/AcrR family transcriptional regulator n=1 Tax=Paenibacillus TaxID=44249 RepID=UPI0004F66E4E|nr:MULTISPECIES: TetR/AcrR family transcriptional regulator [unclassified Paenibacillus]AIQ31366.1 TetR family transcriptional regulator [Paenibacillus sp. FSL P4-0081]OMF28147.1 TetR family transcriptional regulator [Paenibacillus sp. FSL H8-0259]
MNSQISDKKNETRVKLMNKLLPYLRKNGLQSVRMDEISRVMEISRVTLYKYFSTKEEIVEFIVDGFIEYMKELTHNPLDSVQSFGTRFLQIFEQTISLVVYFSDIILQDLETSYPDLFDRFNEAMREREEKILAFFEEGKQKGVFNQLNGRLLIKQDEILRGMFDVKYLMTNQFTVQQVLYDYFQLKRIQLFKPEKLTAIDDEVLMPKIEHLTQKVTKNLF